MLAFPRLLASLFGLFFAAVILLLLRRRGRRKRGSPLSRSSIKVRMKAVPCLFPRDFARCSANFPPCPIGPFARPRPRGGRVIWSSTSSSCPERGGSSSHPASSSLSLDPFHSLRRKLRRSLSYSCSSLAHCGPSPRSKKSLFSLSRFLRCSCVWIASSLPVTYTHPFLTRPFTRLFSL